MKDSLKTWLIEIAAKKMIPSLIKGAIAALVGLVAAHHGLLSSMGIDYDPTGHTIDLNLDTLGAYLLVAGTGGMTALLTLIQHHGEAVVKGTPQDGDLRKTPPLDVPGGDRKGDIPK